MLKKEILIRSRYLGAKGLGCFLSGSYAGTEQRGGMLGYVQSDDEQTWAAKIDKTFISSPKSFALKTNRTNYNYTKSVLSSVIPTFQSIIEPRTENAFKSITAF